MNISIENRDAIRARTNMKNKDGAPNVYNTMNGANTLPEEILK